MSIISENFGMYVHCMGFGICEFALVRCSQIVSNTEYECVCECVSECATVLSAILNSEKYILMAY